MKPARTFSAEDQKRYAKNKKFVILHRDTSQEWLNSIYDIWINQDYLQDGITWEQWCQEYIPAMPRKSLEKAIQREANRLPERIGEEVNKDVSPISNGELPRRQCRQLDTKTEITKKDLSPIPAKAIPVKKEKVLDKEGRIIPDCLVARWARRQEFNDMLQEIQSIKQRLEKFHEEGDEIWRKVGSTALERTAQLYSAVAVSRPHAVCTVCEGWFETLRKGVCPACNSTGFMSKNQYELSNEEIKRIIKNDSLQRLPNSVPRQHPR